MFYDETHDRPFKNLCPLNVRLILSFPNIWDVGLWRDITLGCLFAAYLGNFVAIGINGDRVER
jgi:hypothetical protein